MIVIETEKVALTSPDVVHGQGMYELVRQTGVLDVNSVYAYLLICRDFTETSVVALVDDEVVGMITGYIPPKQPDTLFIWQVAVHGRLRGAGVAGRMFDHLLAGLGAHINRIETTVSPSNIASRRMFEKLAARLNTTITTQAGFPERLFPAGSHEAEPLLIVGPFDSIGNTGV